MILKIILGNSKGNTVPLMAMDTIEALNFPAGTVQKFSREHPELATRNVEIISFAAKDYLKSYVRFLRLGKDGSLPVPTKLVHSFLKTFSENDLFQNFSNKAYGRIIKIGDLPDYKDYKGRKLPDNLFELYESLYIAGVPMNAALNMPLIFSIDEFLREKRGCSYDSQKINEQWIEYQDKLVERNQSKDNISEDEISFMKKKK